MNRKFLRRKTNRSFNQLILYVILIVVCFLFAILFNKIIECVDFLIIFFIIKFLLYKKMTLHLQSFLILNSLLVIWLAIPPINGQIIRIFLSIFIPINITFLSFVVNRFINEAFLKDDLEKEYEILEASLKKKNIYAMTEQELKEYCISKGLSSIECEIAHCIIIERLKGKDFYEKIGYSEAQAKRKRKDILSRLK